MKIMVEIAAGGGHPLMRPSHPRFKSYDPLQWRRRHRDKGHIARGEMNVDSLQIVSPERTAFAALVPVGAKHEMVDDQLRTAAEQVRQRCLAGGRFEGVRFFDFDPGQSTPLSTELVTQVGEFFL